MDTNDLSPMPPKILVVDDEQEIKSLFRIRLRKNIAAKEFVFLHALSGLEALEILNEQQDIDLVLCDINMPEMDGLTLLPKIIEKNALLRVVMVSAYGDMNNIRTAMNLGAFDFVTKPIDFDDLLTTIKKTLTAIEVARKAQFAGELEEKNKNLKEIGQLKSRFFTNISHEFRTPLTVIGGMTEHIRENPEKWLERGSSLIKKNVAGLLSLVNQILDLHKLEVGKLNLNLIQGDIVKMISYITSSFSSLAEDKDISLIVFSEPDSLIMDFDLEKITQILSNLISNAIKFTSSGGEILVRLHLIEDDILSISVKDSGIGIPTKNLDQIFNRFYQVNESENGQGTGVGLALVKELVKIMEGTISAESHPGQGSQFEVRLPVRREAPITNGSIFDIPLNKFPDLASFSEKANPGSSSVLPSVLIIEDNPDILEYLNAILENTYEIFSAFDGEEGIEVALEQIPDLIISDVMMPKKNGYEVCQVLKNDERTSHIPIVLLTAKADQGSRIQGLKRGADAYLAKPFDKEELMVRLGKMLEIRKVLQKRYSSPSTIEQTDDLNLQIEDAFITKIRTLIIKNLDDSMYKGTALCKDLGVSRTQLFKKIKALTGMSTSIFIRAIRLESASEMLKDKDLQVSEVAYSVGFADTTYFSRSFSEHYGVSPGEWRRSILID